MGGSQLSRDTELEQLWKQPGLLRQIFRSGHCGCMMRCQRVYFVPGVKSACFACFVLLSHHNLRQLVLIPCLQTSPSPCPLQHVRQPLCAPAAAAGRCRQAAAAAAGHEEAVRRHAALLLPAGWRQIFIGPPAWLVVILPPQQFNSPGPLPLLKRSPCFVWSAPMLCRVRTFSGAEPRQARLLRRQAQLLAETLLATVEAGLDGLELEGAGAARTQQAQQEPAQQAQQEAGPAAMQVEKGAAEQQARLAQAAAAQLEPAAQDRGSPAAAGGAQAAAGASDAAAGAGSASPPPAGAAAPPAAQTPAAAAGAGGGRTTTPGTDLRAVLGTPAGPLPSAEQSQLQERGMALLQVAHAFHKDISRWLQVHGEILPLCVWHGRAAWGGLPVHLFHHVMH